MATRKTSAPKKDTTKKECASVKSGDRNGLKMKLKVKVTIPLNNILDTESDMFLEILRKI